MNDGIALGGMSANERQQVVCDNDLADRSRVVIPQFRIVKAFLQKLSNENSQLLRTDILPEVSSSL